jgi:hypothetical protein
MNGTLTFASPSPAGDPDADRDTFNFRDRYCIYSAYRDHALFPRVGEITVILFRPVVDHHSLVQENNIICPVESRFDVVG